MNLGNRFVHLLRLKAEEFRPNFYSSHCCLAISFYFFFIGELENNSYLWLCYFPCQINLAFTAKRKTNCRHHDTLTLDQLWQGNMIVFPNTNFGLPSPKTAEQKKLINHVSFTPEGAELLARDQTLVYGTRTRQCSGLAAAMSGVINS